jgi:short-chain fatty acids transporter
MKTAAASPGDKQNQMEAPGWLGKLADGAILVTRRYMPAPYLFALILTFLTAILAIAITRTPLVKLTDQWYRGVWDILTFTMQMALMLMCGHALVDAPLIKRGLDWLSSRPQNEVQAAVLLFFVGWATALLNWGFALVAIGFTVREVSRRLPNVSKGYLAAAGYTGEQVWASGISSSIALVTATPGNPLNFIEKMTGHLYPLRATLWTPYNVVSVAGMAVLMPLLYWRIRPSQSRIPSTDSAAGSTTLASTPAASLDADSAGAHGPAASTQNAPSTPAERIEQSHWITILLVLMGAGYIYTRVADGSFSLDLNMMIFLLLVAGWTLHATPIRYMRAFHEGGRAAAPILLAFPIYGGIMGLMRESGLATWFAEQFVTFSNAHTLPFWSYLSSNVISLFVPSGGGHWAVQGPVMVKAAIALGASLPKTAMAVAFGEQTANLLQPFWALPVVSIGGLSVREMMGYCLLAFLIAFPLFGLTLLIF